LTEGEDTVGQPFHGLERDLVNHFILLKFKQLVTHLILRNYTIIWKVSLVIYSSKYEVVKNLLELNLWTFDLSLLDNNL
jgi:hypothetical protein